MLRDKLNGHSKREKQLGLLENPSPSTLTILRLTPEKRLPINRSQTLTGLSATATHVVDEDRKTNRVDI